MDRPVGGEPKAQAAHASPLGLVAWCLYDWANSAFPTVIATFVFAAYYAKAVAVDEIAGTSEWAYAMSASALAIAVVSPILGAAADQGGRRKPWVAAFSLICIVATALLWFVEPDPSHVLLALVLAALANFAFETATVFYNAMLPDLVPEERIGRLSGWGWGLGYAGGLVCLVIALVVLVQPDPPPFGLDRDAAEHVRASNLLVALWFLVFFIPFLIWTPDTPTSGLGLRRALRLGFATLVATLRNVRHYGQIVLYLTARMIYNNGLNTLFGVGGIYAAVTFGMEIDEILMFGIALNVTAGIGAFAFGWIDDWIGPKRTILISVGSLTLLGALLLVIEEKIWFWALALPLGLFFGPAQSASRSLMARIVPPGLKTEMFGFYALTGKMSAPLGLAAFGWVTDLAASQRAGMATILAFFIAGMLLMLPVRDPRRR